MKKFSHDLFRHTDKAAKGVVDAKNRFEVVLQKYGYTGEKYPAKHWILTEVNIPRQPFNNQLGSDEAQRNFIIKSMVLAKRENIRQYHIYNLAEASPHDMQVNLTEFNTMGVYHSLLDVPKYKMTLTDGGIAYKTTAQFLGGLRYDYDKTAALSLSKEVDGGVFSDELGSSVLVIWAKTTIDNSEEGNAAFTLDEAWNTATLVSAEWDFSRTKAQAKLQSSTLNLSTSPIFIFSPDTQRIATKSSPLEIIQGVGDDEITINYTIGKTGYIDIDLINKSGKRVKTILDQKEMLPGTYNVQLSKKGIQSGVYFIRLLKGQKVVSKRIIVE